jgi:integrase
MLGKARVVAAFHNWALARDIDVLERVQSLRLFALAEIEGLRREMHRASSASRRGGEYVSTKVWTDRCRAVADYIDWLAAFAIDKLDRRDPTLREARKKLESCRDWLLDDLPKPIVGSRKGLTDDQQRAVLRAIVPGSDGNPFEVRNQFRNFVLVLAYHQLGLRLSELLVIKTTDVRLEGASPLVMVERRADDPEETRAKAPAVKTRARPLPVSRPLALLLSQWITEHRSDRTRYPKARRTPFLFVSHFGTPLSKGAAELIFRTLRGCDGVPRDFTPHVLRHTWNDRFSKLASEAQLRDAAEQQTRNFLMGWSDASEQGSTYSRRAIQDEANALMLRLQDATVKED